LLKNAFESSVCMRSEKTKIIFLWAVFFSYATCMALLFQNFVIPNLFPDGSGKLLPNDAIYFDIQAWALAEEIKSNGWGQWRLFVTNEATGNTGILAALYTVFGHDVSVIVPINAALHALGGTLIFIIANSLASNKAIGLYAGVFSGTLFVIFPSALSWYGQVHKDSYAIVGTFVILLIWIQLIKAPLDYKKWALCLIGTCVSIMLIGMVRPYGLTLLFAVSIGAGLMTIINITLRYNRLVALKQAILVLLVLLLILMSINISRDYSVKVERKLDPSAAELIDASTLRTWRWENSEWLPQKLEQYIAGAASTRFSIIKHDHKFKAGSTVDEDIAPQNVTEVIAHLPRAIQVAIFAPFPSMWFESRSIIKLLTTGEMLMYYICIFGGIFLVKYNRKPEVLITAYFAVAFLTILGFTMANLGTLYRVRYAYFFIMLMLGVLGWITFLVEKRILGKITRLFLSKPEVNLNQLRLADDENVPTFSGRKQIITSAAYVMVLTLIGFIGFFYRDILMAHIFGLGMDLDSFFVAIVIPMTVVTILCIPLGAAFTTTFVNFVATREKVVVEELISSVSAATIIMLFIICISILLLMPSILPHLIGDGHSIEYRAQIERHVMLSLSILFFSGPVILGNAVLNGLGKAVMTTTAQIIVPIIAILTVLLYGRVLGVQAVILGMVLGQILNLIALEIQMKRHGYSLKPNFSKWLTIPSNDIRTQYLPLVASAFFVSVSLLVSTLLAISLPSGAVSAFNLGNKMVLLVTGILGAAISTVILPYFSMLIAQHSWLKAKQELSSLLLLLTFLLIPFTVGVFVFSEQIIAIVFEGIADSEIVKITSVMRYAVIQIPFFACNILLLKFATATRQVNKVLFTAAIGLLINIGLSLFLMEKMGVQGIVLGASISIAVSTVILVVMLMVNKHIAALSMLVLMLSWFLFVTLLANIYFESVAGTTAAIIAYLILSLGYYFFYVNSNSNRKMKSVEPAY